MVSYPELRDLDPFVFREGEFTWFEMHRQLKDRTFEIRRALDRLDGWTGSAAESARAKLQERERRLLTSADSVQEGYRLFRDAADRLYAAKAKLGDGPAELAAWGLSVADDGTIVDANRAIRGPGTTQQITELINRYQGLVDDALALANQADTELAAKFDKLGPVTAGVFPATALRAGVPPAGSAPAEVKRWWDSLSPAEQDMLVSSPDSGVGMLDGVPAVARNRANRLRLAAAEPELLAEKQRLMADDSIFGIDDRTKRLREIDDALQGIDALDKRLNTIDTDHQEAFLLGFDSTDLGRAIVASGNPDTAANVATFVPGTYARLGSVGGNIEYSDRMLDSANRAGSPSTSVITWVGYDAPQNPVLEAGFERYADNAKKDLDSFQHGLRVTHEGAPSHNTVIGHSYGTTVIGHAARDEVLDADKLIVIASPGTGADNVADLNMPPDSVYATATRHDIIHLANPDRHDIGIQASHMDDLDPHGLDPTDPAFGAHIFESDPGTPGLLGTYSSAAHSEYFDPGAKSLETIGRIIANLQSL